jgi:hypothetical protein
MTDRDQAKERDRIANYVTGVRLNRKRGAVDSQRTVGEKFLIENKLRKGLEPRFGVEEYQITEKRGGTITVGGPQGQVFRRCTNQVKRVSTTSEEREDGEKREREREWLCAGGVIGVKDLVS